MSILDPGTCGFAKCVAFNLLNEKNGKNKSKNDIFREKLNAFHQHFNHHENFLVNNFKRFTDNFPKILPAIRGLAKTNDGTKEYIFNTFSDETWDTCSKESHSLFDCRGCLHDQKLKSALAMFPIKSLPNKLKAKSIGLLHNDTVLGDITNTVVQNLDEEFKTTYGVSFTKQMKKKFKMEAVDKKRKNKT